MIYMNTRMKMRTRKSFHLTTPNRTRTLASMQLINIFQSFMMNPSVSLVTIDICQSIKNNNNKYLSQLSWKTMKTWPRRKNSTSIPQKIQTLKKFKLHIRRRLLIPRKTALQPQRKKRITVNNKLVPTSALSRKRWQRNSLQISVLSLLLQKFLNFS